MWTLAEPLLDGDPMLGPADTAEQRGRALRLGIPETVAARS
jgi:hypothetical protein